jgi:hypothetical protein
MTVIINGTSGVTSVNGSAAAPSVTGTDTDTGIVYGTNTLSLATGGTTAVTVDSSQNVGIGTSSPSAFTGYTSVSVNNATNGGIYNILVNGTETARLQGYSGIFNVAAKGASTALTFETNGAERARIDSSGNLLVGTTSNSLNGRQTIYFDGAATNGLNVNNSTGAGSPGLFQGYSSGTLKFVVFNNGNVQNTNNSYGAISDVKLKENIIDATPKLAQLNQVRIVNYNLIGDEQKQLGVIAQELEQVFPGMIDESPDYESVTTIDEDGKETTEQVATGTTTKSVKYSVFVPMLIKAIQEQQAIIEQLRADVEALKAA